MEYYSAELYSLKLIVINRAFFSFLSPTQILFQFWAVLELEWHVLVSMEGENSCTSLQGMMGLDSRHQVSIEIDLCILIVSLNRHLEPDPTFGWTFRTRFTLDKVQVSALHESCLITAASTMRSVCMKNGKLNKWNNVLRSWHMTRLV